MEDVSFLLAQGRLLFQFPLRAPLSSTRTPVGLVPCLLPHGLCSLIGETVRSSPHTSRDEAGEQMGRS